MDVDIVHRQTKDNITRLLAFLRENNAVHRRPDDAIIEPCEADLSGHGHRLYATRRGPLDVLARIENNRGYDDLLPDTIEIDFRGRPVRVLALRAIVALKRHARHPHDRSRLPVLQETLRQAEGGNSNVESE